jgi:hypothetical protein
MVVMVRPSDREMLPHPKLQEVCATTEVGVRTTPGDPVAQRTVQPSQCNGPPAVRGYDVPLQTND